ncbi:MAG: DsbA family protein [Pseudomonadota bacterium]
MLRKIIFLTALLFANSALAEPGDNSPKLPEVKTKPFVYAPKASDIVIGDEKAPVTIVEYASLSCSHCAKFFNDEFPILKEKYIDKGKLKLVYRDFPTNAPALKAAELVACVDKDSRYNFIKVIFKNQNRWAFDANFKEGLSNIAALGGVEREKFNTCLEDKASEKVILEVTKEAQEDYGVNATPTLFVNDKKHEGNHDAETMSKVIDSLIADKK